MSEEPQKPPVEPPRLPGRKWKWADGKLHDEPPPSIRRTPMPKPPPPPPADAAPAPAPAADAPPVPTKWQYTDRARLRTQALDFALRSAALLNAKPRSGAEILVEAEHIERWIAKP